jgi:hypothetical protein
MRSQSLEVLLRDLRTWTVTSKALFEALKATTLATLLRVLAQGLLRVL